MKLVSALVATVFTLCLQTISNVDNRDFRALTSYISPWSWSEYTIWIFHLWHEDTYIA